MSDGTPVAEQPQALVEGRWTSGRFTRWPGWPRRSVVCESTSANPGLLAIALLHQGLPREGPGDDGCTREALRRLPELRPEAVVLDLGCGPGGQTLVLAKTPKRVLMPSISTGHISINSTRVRRLKGFRI